MFKINRILVIFTLFIIAKPTFAQNVTSTPYSQFGLGHIQKNNSVVTLGMGGVSNGLRIDNTINNQNPASYTALQWTTFEVGTFSQFIKLKNNTGEAFRNNSGLSYIKVAFPIAKKWGASFGLIPVSGMGYESTVQSTFLDTPVTNIFNGEGGLNQFYIGTGYSINKRLSVGLNASYLFGTLNRSKANEFVDSLGFLNTRQTNSTTIGSIFLNYGIQYKLELNDKRYLTIGLNGNTTSKLSATRSTVATRYFYQSGTERLVDTTQNTSDENGTIVFPMINSLGFAYGETNKWMLAADITLGQWSQLKVFEVNQNLKNTFDLNIGGSYIPNGNAVGNYFKNIEYRFGFNYNKSYINILSQDINQMSLACGFGLPLPKTASKVNLGFEFGQRGTTKLGLIKENYMGIYAGFNFCDKWFIQRKYD